MSASKSVTASYNSASTGSNLLQNPGFESGVTAWTQASSGDYSLIVNDADNLPHAGSYYAWLGGYSSGTDRIEQSVTLPMNVSTATVDFWYEIWTAETSSSMANDTLKVELYNASGVKLSTLTTLSNLSASTGWVKSALFDISAYKGQSLS
ncbi:carbohydrate-binding protein CenC, partial [bacterium]|nr:carbohydrate-binding protein CenC [bacterium]